MTNIVEALIRAEHRAQDLVLNLVLYGARDVWLSFEWASLIGVGIGLVLLAGIIWLRIQADGRQSRRNHR